MNETENRRKLHELLDIALLCNGYGARTREKTGTLPTMFYDFSGHVGTLRMTLYSNGWDSEVCCDHSWFFDLNAPIADGFVEAVRKAADEAMQTTAEEELLELQIAEAEKELEKKKADLSAMRRSLMSMRRKGA